MALSSFGKILTVLDLYSTARPIINVDTISEELGFSKPTSYRYLKELVSAELLQRMSGTSGDYTLGPKIAVLDFISRTTDPLVTISIPFMKKIAERTEFCCLLTQLNQDSCIDVHHEIFKDTHLVSYGRGYPRPVYVGSSPRIFMAHLPKAKILDYYQRFQLNWGKLILQKMKMTFCNKCAKSKNKAIIFLMANLMQKLQAYLYRFVFHLKMRLMP